MNNVDNVDRREACVIASWIKQSFFIVSHQIDSAEETGKSCEFFNSFLANYTSKRLSV